MRTDPRISRESFEKPGLFHLIWQTKLENQARQLNALTQPLLLNNIISYKGFKALAFIGGSADNVWAIDYELNRMFWSRHLTPNPSTVGTAQCPGGLTAITRATPSGAATGSGRGAPPPTRSGGGGINIGMNLASAVYAIASDGGLHVLNPQTGEDLSAPSKFLVPNAKVVGSLFVDGVLYAATADNCGGARNGVWAIQPEDNAKAITTWNTKGGSVVGNAAPTLGADGTVYVATTDGEIVALEPRSLIRKDSFTADTPFTTVPVVFSFKERQLLVAANRDGHLYVLDAGALTVPLSRSPQFVATAPDSGLATWEDAGGSRWILVPSGSSILAFKLVDQGGKPTLVPAWTSPDLKVPSSPIVINGVVFALASGGPQSGSAVLYALDGETGKELWNSGTAISSFAHGSVLSGADGQVYVPTYDNTLYAFGIPLEH
jgi:outer membrane protein assembly factor BamB